VDKPRLQEGLIRDGLIALGLVALCVVTRLASTEGLFPPNFAAVGAAAMMAGFILRRRWLALATPVTAMLTADLLIGFYDWRMMAVVYASFLVPVGIGLAIRASGRSGLRLAGWLGAGAVGNSLVFFGASNLAHWAFTGMYAKTLGGLVACYSAGLPFYKYTLAGDATFTLVLFGSWALARQVRPRPVVGAHV